MKFLVFQHVDVEHPGVFRDFWREEGIEWDAIELDEGEAIPEDLGAYDALVVMGGPMDVWQEEEHPWLVPEKRAIAEWVNVIKKPFLGICLGHQLLAEAIGGGCKPMSTPEVGIEQIRLTAAGEGDPLTHGASGPIHCLQWHGVEVTSLPDGCEVLAENEACAIQAFRFGKNAYGFQYHVEITETTVDDWAAIPAYKSSLEDVLGEGACPRLKADVDAMLGDFNAAARVLHGRFMNLFPAGARRVA